MTNKPERAFHDGKSVRRGHKPTDIGVIQSARWNTRSETWIYRVQINGRTDYIHENELVPFRETAPWDAACEGSFSNAEEFQSLLCFERLLNPPSRIAASFGTARAHFYPYQFKPLLKFLESPNNRLLVADDVGLGKTIEAGYILREMEARQPLQRVLIVVPSRLTIKWKNELAQKFEERFEIIKATDILQLRKKLQKDPEHPPEFHSIISLESARNDDVIDFFESTSLPIDLVIFDEAHRLRNSSTAQYKVAYSICKNADAVVFLTATPVQTGAENLYSLLNLLDPVQFDNLDVFLQQLKANRPFVKAANASRERPPSPEKILQFLEEAKRDPLNQTLTCGEHFRILLERVERMEQSSREELIELQRDISEFSLTAQIISRTRKVEVLPNRPQRNANAPELILHPSEMRFYQAVEELCKKMRPDLYGWGASMQLLQAYRATASCIHAAIELFEERLAENAELNLFSSEEFDEPEEFDKFENVDSSAQIAERKKTPKENTKETTTQSIQALVRSFAPPAHIDTKYSLFLKILGDIWKDDKQEGRAHRKVIVFAFFKRTLRYLSKKLKEQGIQHRKIDGDVKLIDRELAIEEFAEQPEVKILLSSEVGGEGIDLQFASVVVNYDLPWNPMVVEQRIGRIDRLGQTSPTLKIVNFAVKGTVEERILLRLYDRIGLFKDTIGDIDPILGNRVEKIVESALKGELEGEERIKQAEDTIDAMIRQENATHDFLDGSDSLMAADQIFLDEVEALVKKKRVPSPRELFIFSKNFMESAHQGFKLPPQSIEQVGLAEFPPELSLQLNSTFSQDPRCRKFISFLNSSKSTPITFSQEATVHHPRSELINARHPLVSLAVKYYEQKSLHRSFALEVPLSRVDEKKPYMVAGEYAFLINIAKMKGIRSRSEMMPLFIHRQTEFVYRGEIAEDFLITLLEIGETRALVSESTLTWLKAAQDALLETAEQIQQEIKEREEGLNKLRAMRRQENLEATLRAKIKNRRERLTEAKRRLQEETNEERRKGLEFSAKMLQAQIEKSEKEQEQRQKQMKFETNLEVQFTEVAVGVIFITP